MFANELFEAPNKIVVVYAGRFQPFHKGHRQVYEYLVKKFGRDSVYISTSNKVELPKSPFSFTDKSYFMQLQGIPLDRVVESKIPYRSEELMTQFDPNTTNLIVAVSEKDKSRFGQLGFKRDGSLSYFQEMPNKIQKMEPFANHGYVLVVPTFDFTVLGKPMRSATEVRAQYISADDETRKKIIKDLFGKYTAEAQQIMDSKLLSEDIAADSSSTGPVLHGINNESRGHKILARKLSDIEARKKREQEAAKRETEKEKLIRRPAPGAKDQEQVDEMGGVGVIASKSQVKDPRYSMSLTKDVRPGAIMKSLRALKLAEKDKHISPSGVETNMSPQDDDYAINYGKNGLVAKDRKARGVDVKTGNKKVKEGRIPNTAVDPDAWQALLKLPQPVTVNGGMYTYSSDLQRNPNQWRANDGSVITVKNPRELGEWLGKDYNEEWQNYLSGDEYLSWMVDFGYIIPGKNKVDEQGVAEDTEQKFRVTYDIYGSNREKPLYTNTRTVRASSEEEAIKILRDLIGGRNHRIEQGVAEDSVDLDSKTSAKIAALEKKYQEVQNRIELARERRRMQAQKNRGYGRIQSPAETKLQSKASAILQAISQLKQGVAEDDVTEAKSLAKRVRVVQGPNKGKLGWIREIHRGAFKGAAKSYYVDLDDGSQENNVPSSALRLVKDGVTEAQPARRSMPWSVWNTKSARDQQLLKSLYPNLVITDRPKQKAERNPRQEKINYAEVAQKIGEVFGNTFPNGDPLDWLIPYMERRWGIRDNIGQHLDRAARKYLHARDYYDYLAQSWDQVADDNNLDGVTRDNNPWRVSEGLRDPKDNPCWKGYYPVGTKKKNGRTVPNCVPKPKK